MVTTVAGVLKFDYLLYLQEDHQQYPPATPKMPALEDNAPSGLEKLPLEVRLMIWEAMFPETRIHGVVVRGSWSQSFTIRIQPVSLPMVFQICHESRDFAQKRFKCFAINGHAELANFSVPYGYCNPKIDALYFPHEVSMTDSALNFRPFRRIAIAICSYGNPRAFIPRPNSNFATETSDDRLHICFVMEEYIIPSLGRLFCRSVRPVGFPEPKLLTKGIHPFYEGIMTWISGMERCMEGGYAPVVTVGDMPPVSCACPDRFEEMKREFEVKRNEKDEIGLEDAKRASARERHDKIRRGDEQSAPSVHGMILRPRVR